METSIGRTSLSSLKSKIIVKEGEKRLNGHKYSLTNYLRKCKQSDCLLHHRSEGSQGDVG